MSVDFLADFLEKPVIYKMIEKATDLEHLTGIDLTVPEDAFLQQFHPYSSIERREIALIPCRPAEAGTTPSRRCRRVAQSVTSRNGTNSHPAPR